jgi:ribosomal protein S27AE
MTKLSTVANDDTKEDQSWHDLSKEKNYRCKDCGEMILRADKDLFFKSGRCGVCEQKHKEK